MTSHCRVGPDEVRLAYRSWGDPDAPPAVLLHGLGGDGSTWDDVAPALAAGRRIHAYDARGHGRSDHPGTYSFELMRDDLLGFLDELGLQRADLLGHSMGGVVSYLFAISHPDRVGRLVLEETPPPFPRPDVVAPDRPNEPVPYDWEVIAAIRSQVRAPLPTWLAGLPGIAAPTLLIAGGATSQVPQDRIADMANAIPDSKLITIEAGHLVHATCRDEFVAVVDEHLTS